jgi:hypothetical protein
MHLIVIMHLRSSNDGEWLGRNFHVVPMPALRAKIVAQARHYTRACVDASTMDPVPCHAEAMLSRVMPRPAQRPCPVWPSIGVTTCNFSQDYPRSIHFSPLPPVRLRSSQTLPVWELRSGPIPGCPFLWCPSSHSLHRTKKRNSGFLILKDTGWLDNQ